MEPTPPSPVNARARARTTSFSATTAVVHSPEHDSVSNPQQQTMDPHQMYPWPSERAKAAAEATMSPPVSPKQHAMAAGQVEFVEPLQETNNVHNRHEPWVSTTDNNSTDSNNEDDDINKNSDDDHSSPYTHLLRSRTLTHDGHSKESHSTCSASSSSSSYTSTSSVSMASSAASSSTSLSSAAYSYAFSPLSEATTSSAVDTLKSSGHHSPSTTSGLQRLEIEKTELFLIDTPPSSHVTSPSSPSSKSALVSVDEKTQHTPPTAATPASVSATAHKSRKSTSQIIREISDLVDGRDKTIKVVQYFAKVFLWLFLSDTKQYKVLADRVKALAKQFSTTRKVLRLGHFVDPLSTVLTLAATLSMNYQKKGSLAAVMRKPCHQTWRDTTRERLGMLSSVLGFCQDISDDIYCLGVIGVLDRSFSDKAEPWSNRLWMIGVSIDLHENLQSILDVRRQIKTLEKTIETSEEKEQVRCAKLAQLANKLHWLQVTTVKLGGDFLFCGYDNLHCSFSDGFQAITGFASGIAGAYKFVGKIMES